MIKLIIVMAIATSLGGGKAYLDYKLQQELDHTIVSNQVAAEYSKISSSLLGAVIIEDINFDNYIQIDKIILPKAYQFYNSLPETMSLQLEGIQIPINNTVKPIPILISALGYTPYYISPKELYALGYSKITANISLNAKLQNKKLSISGKVTTNKWGDLTITAKLNKVYKSLETIELNTLQLKYFDTGLIKKIIEHITRRNKTTSNQLKQDFITKLKANITQTNIIDNIQQFIHNPNVLTVDLQPNFPMNLNMLKTFPVQKISLNIVAD